MLGYFETANLVDVLNGWKIVPPSFLPKARRLGGDVRAGAEVSTTTSVKTNDHSGTSVQHGSDSALTLEGSCMTFAADHQSSEASRGVWRNRLAVVLLAFMALLLASPRTAQADATVVDINRASSSADLTDKLPTSGSFVLQYTFEGEVTDAAVDIWPARIRQCKDGPAEPGSRQTYHLNFSLNTADGKTVGKTTVPHLQVSQRFCFRFSALTKAAPDASKLQLVLQQQAHLIGTPPEAYLLAQRLASAVAKDFCDLDAKSASGKAKCAELDLKPLEGPLLQAVLKAHQDEADAQSKQGEYDRFVARHLDKVKSASQFKPPPAIEAKVPSAAWAKVVTQATITQALKDVQANAGKLGPETTRAMEQWLHELQDSLTLAEESLPKAHSARELAAASEPAARAAQAEVALAFFKENLRALSMTSLDVEADTNDFKNYVSPELGIALALPFVKKSSASLIPYAAVNIYFQPVDRELALDKLVNPFFQRMSVTVGLTLTQDLKVPGADLSPPALGSFTVIGAGYRILPFARVAALAILAKETPHGGLSDESKLITAGALAISGDLDLITFIGNSVK